MNAACPITCELFSPWVRRSRMTRSRFFHLLDCFVAIRAGLAIGKGYGPANPMVPLYQKAGVDR